MTIRGRAHQLREIVERRVYAPIGRRSVKRLTGRRVERLLR